MESVGARRSEWQGVSLPAWKVTSPPDSCAEGSLLLAVSLRKLLRRAKARFGANFRLNGRNV